MNAKWTTTVIISLLLASIWIVVTTKANPDSASFNASAYENNQWTAPTLGYTSNNYRTEEATSAQSTTFRNYSIQDTIPSGSTIDKVYVKAEGYVSISPAQIVSGLVSWDGGSTWSDGGSWHGFGFGESETTKTWNVTDVTAWTRDKLNDTNLRVKFQYTSTGGCYPNNTYFMSWEDRLDQWVLKSVSKAQAGDSILIFDDETKEIRLSKIYQLDVHFGKWTILDIYSGSLTVTKEELNESKDWTWNAHVCFTENHGVEWSYDDTGKLRTRGTAGELKRNMYLSHLWHDPPYFRNTAVPLEDNRIKWFPITEITQSKLVGAVYNIWMENPLERPFLKFLTDKEMEELIEIGEKLGIGLEMLFDPPPVQKDTGYVDWMGVEVHWTPPAPSRSWHDVEVWDLNLTARDWTDEAVWTIDLRAREWINEALWTTNLTARDWTDEANWILNLTGRDWVDEAVWVINLSARDWIGEAVWIANLTARSWQDAQVWDLTALTRDWRDVVDWTITTSARTWNDVASWIFDVIAEGVAQIPFGGNLLDDEPPRDIDDVKGYPVLGIWLIVVAVIAGSAEAYRRYRKKVRARLRRLRKKVKKPKRGDSLE